MGIERRLKCSSAIGLDGVMWVTTALSPEFGPDGPLTDLLLPLAGRHKLTIMRKVNATQPIRVCALGGAITLVCLMNSSR